MISFTFSAYSQRTQISYSFYTALDFSRGVEIRGEFEDWYLSFQLENFIENQVSFINWGGSIGMIKSTRDFDFIGGIRVGFMTFDGDQKPAYGIEIESDYKINDRVFIGLRFAHDSYANSTLTEYKHDSLDRVFLKIGYKF